MPKQRVILVGGGLANGLLAFRLTQARPDVELLVIEAERLGGNHTWCFHAADLTPAQGAWIAPFVAHQWPGYEVRFPDRRRRLALGYRCVTAESFRAAVEAVLKRPVVTARARDVNARTVVLENGDALEADLVLDGRGAGGTAGVAMAWQGFCGQELRLAGGHGLTEPIIMDATVPQTGGYRFFYCLPLAADLVLVEDTRYQDGRNLDLAAMRGAIGDYAARRGWRVEAVEREESGSLPIVLSGRPPLPGGGGVPVGMRAGLFHPVTGYSLPEAVRTADRIAAAPTLTTEALRPAALAAIDRHWRGQGFYKLLNRMLFMAGEPEERWRVLSRFYALPEPLIARFYAGATTKRDTLRLVTGRPPVPFAAALGCLRPSSARAFAEANEI